jgi:tetratricopeptide (TPR) repeat protein
MIEQTDVPAGTGPGVPVGSRPVLSQEVRASLEAVRVAREAAQVRARRQTMRARLWFAASLAALAGAGFVFAPRFAHRWHARAHVRASIHAAPRAPAPTPLAVVQAAAPVASPAAPRAAAAQLEAPAVSAPAPRLPPATAEQQANARDVGSSGASSEETCDPAAVRHAPWRLSPDACARAFDADPTNAALALAVAHASLVRGRFVDAAQWATRTLSLDPNAAEAYVIIARAEKATGRQDEAGAAYAHYLELAPRGWHQAEARAAVQRTRAAPPDSPGRR